MLAPVGSQWSDEAYEIESVTVYIDMICFCVISSSLPRLLLQLLLRLLPLRRRASRAEHGLFLKVSVRFRRVTDNPAPHQQRTGTRSYQRVRSSPP